MRVVGGIYLERVVSTGENVICGSGGRASETLNRLGIPVRLTSYVGGQRSKDIDHQVENVWKAELDAYSAHNTICFTYFHELSTPQISHSNLPPKDLPTIRVSDEVILQYGMLEGEAVLEGSRIVYDPQNPINPKYFHANGSKAQELAYVLNAQEALQLTGKATIGEAAAFLLGLPNVEVAVVKMGAMGAEVHTSGNVQRVNAYRSPIVRPIGSGDVFSAIFAHYWGAESASPQQAAVLASRATALYCARKSFPRDMETCSEENFLFPPVLPTRDQTESQIYLAGPFFSMSQLWLVEEARSLLEGTGINVFSPYHDVGIGDADKVVPKDIDAIESAHSMLALCDGLDSGTMFEVGYAIKRGLPVVAYSQTASKNDLKMLQGTGCRICRDFASAIYHAQWEAIS